jgi:hypothetical protein
MHFLYKPFQEPKQAVYSADTSIIDNAIASED